MSAVPKKKLCWNCEGNISRDVDNCHYCGVYLHGAESEEEDAHWNPNYYPSSKPEEVPSPLYSIPQEATEKENDNEITASKDKGSFARSLLFLQLKRDLFPLLFLMMGSVFFLFGVVLLLFSQNGTLTLQWQGHSGFYFLAFAFPLMIFGWRFLQQLEDHE